MARVHGLHHVTCIAGDPAENLAFYNRVLGMRLVKRTVNQDAPDTYHLFYADAAGSPGTEAPFPWHQDNGYNFVEPQCYMTCWIALTDATKESGCPWVVPEIHRMGTLEHWTTPLGYRCLEENPPGAEPIEAPAGSIVVFTSLTPHATGANRTRGPRKAYIVQLAVDGTCQTKPNPETGAIDQILQNDPARQFLIT